jgi:hypothetical protein
MHYTLVVGSLVFCQRTGIATELAVVATAQFHNTLEFSCPSYLSDGLICLRLESGVCSALNAWMMSYAYKNKKNSPNAFYTLHTGIETDIDCLPVISSHVLCCKP